MKEGRVDVYSEREGKGRPEEGLMEIFGVVGEKGSPRNRIRGEEG